MFQKGLSIMKVGLSEVRLRDSYIKFYEEQKGEGLVLHATPTSREESLVNLVEGFRILHTKIQESFCHMIILHPCPQLTGSLVWLTLLIAWCILHTMECSHLSHDNLC